MQSVGDSNKKMFHLYITNHKAIAKKMREGVHYKSEHRKIPKAEAFSL